MPLKIVQSPETGKYYPVNIAGETPTEEEKARIREYLSQREKPVEPQEVEKEYEAKSGIVGAFDVGTDLMANQLYSTVEGIGNITGIKALQDFGREGAESYSESAAQKSEGLTRLGDVEGGYTGAKFVAETFGQAAPQIGTALAVGAATAALAPALPLAFVAGSVAATLPLLFGANRERQKEVDEAEGRPVEVNEGAAFIAGLGQSFLESLSLKFLTAVNKAGLKIDTTKFAERGLLTGIQRAAPKATAVGVAAGKGAGVEGLTEIGQQAIERIQAGLDPLSDDAMAEYLEAGVAGGIVGGGLRGTVATATELSGKKEEADKLKELAEDEQTDIKRDQEALKRSRASFNQEPLKLQVEQGGVVTDALSDEQIGRAIGRRTAAEREILPDELTEVEKKELSLFRTRNNIPQDKPISLSEVRSALGEDKANELASQQGLTADSRRYPLITQNNKFTHEQYKKVLDEIGKKQKKEFTETELDQAIQKVTGNFSDEFTIDIRNALITTGNLRATQDQIYNYETQTLFPLKKVKFQKTTPLAQGKDYTVEGSVAKKANQLTEERDRLQNRLDEIPKEIENKENLIAKLDQLQNIDLTTDEGMKTAGLYLGKKFKPLPKNATPQRRRQNAQRIATEVRRRAGQIGNLEVEPTGERKNLKNLREEVENTKNAIESLSQEIDAMKTKDFRIESTEKGGRGMQSLNDPKTLRFALRNKEIDLKLAEKRLKNQKKAKESDEVLQATDNEISILKTEIDEFKNRLDNPTAPVQENIEQNDGNASSAGAEVAMGKPFSPKYRAKMAAIGSRLKKYMYKELKLNPEQVGLILDKLIDPNKNFVTFGAEQRAAGTDIAENKRMIYLATDLFDPEMVEKGNLNEAYKRLKSTLNHEILHSLRATNIITDPEFNALVKAAKTRKRVIFKDGKLTERKYSYFEHALNLYPRSKTRNDGVEVQFYPDMSDQKYAEMVEEEAVAEMFRDVMDGKLKMGGKPRTLLQRIKDFFLYLFKSHQDNGVISVEQIFEDIKSGKIGDTRRGRAGDDDRGKRLSISRAFMEAEENYTEGYKYKDMGFHKIVKNMLDEGYKFNPETIEYLGMKEGSEIVPPVEDYVANLYTDRGLDYLQSRHSGDRGRNLALLYQGKVGISQAEVDRQPRKDDMSFVPDEQALEKIKFDLWKITQAHLIHLPDRIPLFRIGPVDSKNLYKGQMHSYSLTPNPSQMGMYKNKRSFAYKEYIKKRKAELGLFGRGQVEPEVQGYLVDKEDIVVAPNLIRGDIFAKDPEQEVLVKPADIMRADIDEYEYIYGKPDVRVRRSKGRELGFQVSPKVNMIPSDTTLISLTNFIKENPYGFTITSDTFEPVPTGFVVAPVKAAEIPVGKDLSLDFLREWINNAKDISGILNREIFMGGWKDSKTDDYYLDNTIIFDNKEEALYVGQASDQKAIFHIDELNEIRTEDGIRELKEGGAYRDQLAERYRRSVEKASSLFDEARVQRGRLPIGGRAVDQEFKKRSISRLDPELFQISSLPEVDLSTLEFVSRLGENDKPENIVKVVRNYLDERMQRSGVDFRVDYTDPDPEVLEKIATLMASEAEVALARDGNAIGWYDNKLKLAKKLFGLVHPEIVNKKDHEAAFDFALAVTSNGTSVVDNSKFAIEAYRSWVRNGRFDIKGYGDKVDAMQKAFSFYNALYDFYDRTRGNKTTAERVADFLDEKMTVRDLRESDFLRTISEEYDLNILASLAQESVDTEVTVSAIIGAKIGNGFYQNLRGNYNNLTMDRWWQRFWNRITGNPFVKTGDATKIQAYRDFIDQLKRPKRDLPDIDRQALRATIKSMDNPVIKTGKFEGGIQDVDTNIVDIALQFAVERNKIYKRISNEGVGKLKGEAKRAIVARNREAAGIDENTDMSKVANRMVRNFAETLDDSPRGPLERSYMRSAVDRAIKILEQDKIVEPNSLTVADFQALMWFYEKSLLRNLGAKTGRGSENDYVDGAIAFLREEGISDDNIQEALPTTDGHRINRGVSPDTGNEQLSERASDVSKKIQDFQTQGEFDAEIRRRTDANKQSIDDRRRSIGRYIDDSIKERTRVEGTTRGDVMTHQHKMMYTASANAIADRLAGKIPNFIPVIGGKKIPFVGFDQKKSKELSDLFIRYFQDRMIPVGRMIDELQEKGFKLSDAFDPVMQEQLMQGKTGVLLENKKETIYKKPMDIIKKFQYSEADLNALQEVSRNASDPDQQGYVTEMREKFYPSFWKRILFGDQSKKLVMAETYLYALHAKERNAYIRQIDVNKVNQFPNRGSGMSDTEADAIINWFKQQPESSRELLNDLQESVREVIADTNKTREDAGLQRIFDTGPRWKDYVPLKGIFHVEDETVDYSNGSARLPSQQPMFGAMFAEDRQVKGRMEYAPNILANVFTQNANSTIRAERNKVGLSMLNLIRQDPELLRDYAQIQDIPGQTRRRDARTGILSSKPNTRLQDALDKNVLVVKEDGNEVNIRFNSAVMAGAFRGDTAINIQGFMVPQIGRFNRFLSNINTSYNPAFIIPNFARDLQTALVNIDQYEGENLKKTVFKRTLPMARGVMRAVNRDPSKRDTTSPEAKAYLDFVANGGKNVTNQMTTLEDQANDISRIMGEIAEGGLVGNLQKVRNGWVGDKTASIFSYVENLNTAAENGVRVATYQTLLDTGKYSKEQAALAARNITVNFAKGGELKQPFNSLYLFYNASLQGSFALLQAFSKSAKVRRLWMGLLFLGISLDQLGALFSDEDEEGMKQYDKITDFMHEHTMILPNFGNVAEAVTGKELEMKTFISIPLPYGVNMAYNTGRAVSRRLRGGYTGAQATSTIMSTFFEAVNPYGGMESFDNFVFPTILDPYMSLKNNIDYDKTPIYREVSQFAVGTPDSQAYWNSASPSAVGVAQFLNRATGGSTVRKGLIDWSPDSIDFIFGYLTGGVGVFVQRSANAGYQVVSGNVFRSFEDGLSSQELREGIRQTPFVRRVLYSTSEREDTGMFIAKRNEVFIARKELQAAAQTGDPTEIQAVRDRYKDELKVYGIIRAINSKRQKLTTARNQLLRADLKRLGIDEQERERRLEILDKAIQKLIQRGNAVMRDVDMSYTTELGLTG